MSHVLFSRFRPLFSVLSLLSALLTTALSSGCGRRAEASPNTDDRPKVTVARPVTGHFTDFTEYAGHAEAPGVVEIRARVSGHLVRAPFQEGSEVKKGALLFVIDPRPFEVAVARAKAELESTRADRELARKNAARAERLFAGSVISERERDIQAAALLQLSAREQVAAAALAGAELDLEYAHVRSPIAGRIGRKLVTEGNLVGPNVASPLATVVSIDPLYVYVEMDEARGIHLSRDIAVAQVGFSGEEGYPHSAKIDFIDNRVEPGTGTLRVRAVVENADGKLSHGLFARVRIMGRERKDAVFVADQAIATDQDRRFVWVVGAEGKVERRVVKLGPLEQGLRVVWDGLSPSDLVIVRGLQRVHAGATVVPEIVAMQGADPSESQRRAAR